VPAKGKTKVSDEKRRQIATARLIGKTAKTIAKETGLAQKTVEKQANDPRTSRFILRERSRSERALEQAYRLGLASILVHLRSGNPELVIQARRDALKYATAGDPPLMAVTLPDSSCGDFTLEELLSTMRTYSQRQAG